MLFPRCGFVKSVICIKRDPFPSYTILKFLPSRISATPALCTRVCELLYFHFLKFSFSKRFFLPSHCAFSLFPSCRSGPSFRKKLLKGLAVSQKAFTFSSRVFLCTCKLLLPYYHRWCEQLISFGYTTTFSQSRKLDSAQYNAAQSFGERVSCSGPYILR